MQTVMRAFVHQGAHPIPHEAESANASRRRRQLIVQEDIIMNNGGREESTEYCDSITPHRAIGGRRKQSSDRRVC
jgi:hypothetical protein